MCSCVVYLPVPGCGCCRLLHAGSLGLLWTAADCACWCCRAGTGDCVLRLRPTACALRVCRAARRREEWRTQPLRVCAQPRNAVPAARCCRAGRWCRCFGSDRTPGVAPQGVFRSRTVSTTVAKWFAPIARGTVVKICRFGLLRDA
jgi:hypothetical protein